jgi:hypothetical protein
VLIGVAAVILMSRSPAHLAKDLTRRLVLGQERSQPSGDDPRTGPRPQ